MATWGLRYYSRGRYRRPILHAVSYSFEGRTVTKQEYDAIYARRSAAIEAFANLSLEETRSEGAREAFETPNAALRH